jgi:hypothetical protein
MIYHREKNTAPHFNEILLQNTYKCSLTKSIADAVDLVFLVAVVPPANFYGLFQKVLAIWLPIV